MPPKRQKPLPFQRTAIQRAARSSATSAPTPDAQNATPVPLEASASPALSATPTPTPRSPAPPLAGRPKQLRHS